MKKSYEAPSAEIIKFNYRDQVVAASGGSDFLGENNSNNFDDQTPTVNPGGHIMPSNPGKHNGRPW